jgi:hypothetical protein
MRTKFANKLKNQMSMDEIKNKIQLKIINANKQVKIREDELNQKKK